MAPCSIRFRPLDQPPRPSPSEEDAVGIDGPSRLLETTAPEARRCVFPPDAPADDVRAALRARGGKTSFELSISLGGTRAPRPGWSPYLDEDEQPYMVMGEMTSGAPWSLCETSRRRMRRRRTRAIGRTPTTQRASVRAGDLTGRVCASWHARGRLESGGLVGRAGRAAPRREHPHLPRA